MLPISFLLFSGPPIITTANGVNEIQEAKHTGEKVMK